MTTDVSSIFADDQYYYITSSSFPSYKILDGSTVNEELLDQRLLRIIRKEATRTTEKYKTPNSDEKKVLMSLVKALDECNDKMTPEDIQTKIFSVGKENGYKDNLRDWFKLIYEVVFGDENGPRIGFFISFFGVKETQNLIKEKIM